MSEKNKLKDNSDRERESKVKILEALSRGFKHSFNVLETESGVSPRTLSKWLREFVAKDYVKKVDKEYVITEAGTSKLNELRSKVFGVYAIKNIPDNSQVMPIAFPDGIPAAGSYWTSGIRKGSDPHSYVSDDVRAQVEEEIRRFSEELKKLDPNAKGVLLTFKGQKKI